LKKSFIQKKFHAGKKLKENFRTKKILRWEKHVKKVREEKFLLDSDENKRASIFYSMKS
jgi:hypothetical protein